MKKLTLLGLALIALISCSQKKNKAEPTPGQQVGLWLSTEEKARYDAAQTGSDEVCGTFLKFLNNGRRVVVQTFALKILDNGQSEMCNMPQASSIYELECNGIKERVDLRSGKAEITRDGGACDAQATADATTMTIVSVCGKDAKTETGSYFRVTEEGFLNYVKRADFCREKIDGVNTADEPDLQIKVQGEE